MTTIKTFVFNHFSQNTYLIYDDTKEAVLIDPGCFFDPEKEELAKFINDNDLQLKKVLYTHCHLDHAFGANFIGKTFKGLEFIAHKEENIFIDDAINQSLRFGIKMEQPPELTSFINEDDSVTFGNSVFKALHVPGHSPGSICYVNETDKYVLVGDVLFSGSIGRTDLPGGNQDSLISGIKTKLFALPDNFVAYSGHGPATTIGAEKASNPFLR